jgi:hypothetical protein
MSRVFDASWLEAVSGALQLPESRRKNMIDIAGYPSWENVNSNFLKFYFDKDEEHRFGLLFLNSLLDIIEDKWADDWVHSESESFDASELVDVYRINSQANTSKNKRKLDRTIFETPFTIERETGRIDLLIKGKVEDENLNEYYCPWAIIIENKIYHDLDNPLDEYWEKVKADFKMGLILNLSLLAEPQVVKLSKEDDIQYTNVTHQMLIEKVQFNLGDYFENSDDRHLLYLKDYFSNIQSHYDMEKPNENTEKNIELLRQYNEEIKKLNGVVAETRNYMFRNINDVMERYGFDPATNYISYDKHYYSKDKNGDRLPIRMYIVIYPLLESDWFTPIIELYGDYCKYGDEVKRRLKEMHFYHNMPSYLKEDTDNKNGYYHLVQIDTKLDAKNQDVKSEFERAFSSFYGKGEDGKSCYDKVLAVVQSVIKDTKET